MSKFISRESVFYAFAFFTASQAWAENRFVQIEAYNRQERSAIANSGVSIEFVRSDSVWGFANENAIEKLNRAGIKILGNFSEKTARGGHEGSSGFPSEDSKYHTYDQVLSTLRGLVSKNSDIAQLQSIGKSTQNRDLWAIHINTSTDALKSGSSNKPGVIFMGNHHAREHLSVEMPLLLSQHLISNRKDPKISALLASRDIWIIPMVNPDGAEYDVEGGDYKYWRKNRRDNGDGTFGVDLNRNYGFAWGTGGSDTDTSSDVYMGKSAFSEPETQAIRDFVTARTNATMLLSFHTYSELILYPWGHTFDPITKEQDKAVFEKMAKTMAQWNHYKPEQSSDLYIASGDTTDWAYGERGIFAFTFELSPSGPFSGGFYPGADMIDKVFKDNLQPCLYMLDVAGNPYQVLNTSPSPWLQTYIEHRQFDEFSSDLF